MTFDIGPDGARDPVENLLAVSGNLLLHAIVEARPPAKGKGDASAT
jgi:hypothetical protein